MASTSEASATEPSATKVSATEASATEASATEAGPSTSDGDPGISSLTEYTKIVKRVFDTKQGTVLATLLSLRDVHVHNSLYSGDIPALVAEHCQAPVADLLSNHLTCIKLICENNYSQAYDKQSAIVAGVVKLLQSQAEQNWCLPLMYTVCLDLRLLAQKTEAEAHCDGKILERAAESLLTCFRVCASDNRASATNTKRLGMLNIVNHLLRVYFRINKLHLCKPILRVMDCSPYRDQYPKSQQVTYRYFSGRKFMFEADYQKANQLLTYAFENCHKDSIKNKKQILTCLIPVKMLLGYMPSTQLLEKYEMMQFAELVKAVKEGNLRGIEKVMSDHETFLIDNGIYFVVEQLKVTANRNLFKRVFLCEGSHKIDIAVFHAALKLMGYDDIDMDGAQCLISKVIGDGKMKAYISFHHKKVVLSLRNPFPPLSSLKSELMFQHI